MEQKFDFNDILIEPKVSSSIKSRYKDIDPYYYVNNIVHLPLMSAPMSSVIDLDNYAQICRNYIIPVFPRNVSVDMFNNEFESHRVGDSFMFNSVGLNDFKKYYIDNKKFDKRIQSYVLIDVANGHQEEILELVNKAKEKNPYLVIMVGNIANPETYKYYAKSNNVSFIRTGIGAGNGCLTTMNTGVGYPSASLIRETYLIKEDMEQVIYHNNRNKGKIFTNTLINNLPKIVADGGMKDYSDIVKALGLGADYVMLGSILNKSLESAGDNFLWGFNVNDTIAKWGYKHSLPIKKKFYGMSTKIAQTELGNKTLKTSEGVVRYRKVEYTLQQWVENFTHYLITAMSYSDARDINQFIGKVNFNLITKNSYERFNK